MCVQSLNLTATYSNVGYHISTLVLTRRRLKKQNTNNFKNRTEKGHTEIVNNDSGKVVGKSKTAPETRRTLETCSLEFWFLGVGLLCSDIILCWYCGHSGFGLGILELTW